MTGDSPSEPPTDEPAGGFQTTHWSVVRAAGHSHDGSAEAALERLCRVYWYPLYAYVRRRGYGAHDAQDLTQEFFARLLSRKTFQRADPERGRLRSFLLKSLQHFLANEWVRGQAQKRGGGLNPIPLDEATAEQIYQQEPSALLAPETLFDKRWAVTLVDQALHRLGTEYAAAGKGAQFDQFKGLLLTEGSGEVYRETALRNGMTEGAVKVAVHRLRQRFRETVRAEIAQTVTTSAEVEGELHCLMAALTE